MSRSEKAVSIITKECYRLGINTEFIDYGCERAEFMLRARVSFASCVLSGIAEAKTQQELFVYYKKLA